MECSSSNLSTMCTCPYSLEPYGKCSAATFVLFCENKALGRICVTGFVGQRKAPWCVPPGMEWESLAPKEELLTVGLLLSAPQEKRLAGERYAEVHEQLSGMKGRSEREIQSLKEHLRLAMAALQEGQQLGNSLDH